VTRFLGGFLAAIALAAIVVAVVVNVGWFPAGADQPYFPMERKMAKVALNTAIKREMPQPPYPFTPTDADLAAGAKGYMENCAVCHGSGSGGESHIVKGMYVEPPQLNKHGVDDDPAGETYWKIEHGIRFTGMPAFKGILPEKDIWQIAFFLKHGSKDLPPAVAAIWNKPHGD
jgi:thiosulfate dehydrogenase